MKCMPVLDDHMPTTYLLLENFDSDKNDKDDRIFLSLEENITLYRQMDCSSGVRKMFVWRIYKNEF